MKKPTSEADKSYSQKVPKLAPLTFSHAGPCERTASGLGLSPKIVALIAAILSPSDSIANPKLAVRRARTLLVAAMQALPQSESSRIGQFNPKEEKIISQERSQDIEAREIINAGCCGVIIKDGKVVKGMTLAKAFDQQTEDGTWTDRARTAPYKTKRGFADALRKYKLLYESPKPLRGGEDDEGSKQWVRIDVVKILEKKQIRSIQVRENASKKGKSGAKASSKIDSQ